MPTESSSEQRPLCPSAQPDWPGSQLIGVVGGTAEEPRVLPLDKPVAPSESLLNLARPVEPTEVFRFAAPCLCHGCVHFEQERCGLVERVVQLLPIVTRELPPCAIRPSCRWWLQEGEAACWRCPQVVTENLNPSRLMMEAAGSQAVPPRG